MGRMGTDERRGCRSEVDPDAALGDQRRHLGLKGWDQGGNGVVSGGSSGGGAGKPSGRRDQHRPCGRAGDTPARGGLAAGCSASTAGRWEALLDGSEGSVGHVHIRDLSGMIWDHGRFKYKGDLFRLWS